jgi:uncharacterized glyoxalase superfamily protein PhnB
MPSVTNSVFTAKTIVPSFTVDDLQKSIAFYEGLGFAIADRWEENGKLLGVMMKAGTQLISFSQDDWQKGRDRQKGVGVRLHIETTQDIDDVAARAKAAGIALDKDPYDTEWKTRMFEVTDPTGFKLSISSEWPQSH